MTSKTIRNAVIVTAKGGNQSVGNKNVLPVLGVPVVAYALRAAKLSNYAGALYLSTEDPAIKAIGEKEGAQIIDRPLVLSAPDSLHKDVIKHAVTYVHEHNSALENVIVLLGNTVMVTPGLIDRAFALLDENGCDSCISVWKAQDDHPYRALQVNQDGYIESFLDATKNSNRQSYPSVYFYDQGIWGFKWQCALDQVGPKPWVWLGNRCRMIERPWVTGRDIHSWIDLSASAWYLTAVQPQDVGDYQHEI